MIGDSKEESVDPTGLTIGVSATEAERAVRSSRCWPASTWCAPGARIRVMTQDGFPIYDQSETPSRRLHRLCHSGVTLAANHALTVAPMIARGALDTVAGRALQRTEVPCSSGWLRRAQPSPSPSTASRCAARAGDTVAAALLAAGIDHCRTTPVSGAPRAPYCLMGVCFDCLVDDRRRRQPPGLPRAGARGHGGRDADRQARGRAMTQGRRPRVILRPRRDRRAARRALPRRRSPRAPALRPCCSTRIPASAARSTAPSPSDAGHGPRDPRRGLLGGRAIWRPRPRRAAR